MISHADFIARLIKAFPEMKDEVRDEDGLLHLEMSVFSRFTLSAIDTGNRELLEGYFTFADDLFRHADEEVKNAVYVSYLEHLNVTDGKARRAWALDRMPSALRIGFREIKEYLDQMPGRKVANGRRAKVAALSFVPLGQQNLTDWHWDRSGSIPMLGFYVERLLEPYPRDSFL